MVIFIFAPSARDLVGIHLREAEALPAEVFQRCAYQVEFPVVDDEKSVVKRLARPDRKTTVLRVELRDFRRDHFYRNAFALKTGDPDPTAMPTESSQPCRRRTAASQSRRRARKRRSEAPAP